jgi:hypothetical protein
MSSPKRAAKAIAKTSGAQASIAQSSLAKSAAKAAAKSAPKPLAAPAPAAAKVQVLDGASADAKRLAGVLEQGVIDGKLDMVALEALQKLIAAACRVYTARVEAGEPILPVPKNSISATDVMVTASGLLRAADLAVFELGMWQSWTGR